MEKRHKYRAKRNELKMSQEELAKKIGCSTGHYANMENGEKPLLPHWQEKIEAFYESR